jgi:cellulose synthase/poly-beta-1,6-N-acetylglucosamine synthase-like glycosyltransferase
MVPAYINGKKHYVTNSAPTIKDIKRIKKEKDLEKIPMFKIQITTRGNELHVVKRSIRSVFKLAEEPLYKNRLRIDVVTDELSDKRNLEKVFKTNPVPLNIYVVPANYKTENNTLKKARALHYMIEIRKAEKKTERGYIVYFDSESVITPLDFRRLVYNTIKHEKQITEGPIIYPIGWFKTNLISRQIEATRPWNCYHCHKIMTNPPPIHLHGSNLVVEENLAIDLGWDFGNLDGEPLIVEDILFGLKAYIKYGKNVFGWHGAELLEQPPKSIKDSVRQRTRWILGTWQALEVLKRSSDFKELRYSERLKIRATIGYRVTLYSLGFFAAILFFIFMGLWISGIAIGIDLLEINAFWFSIWTIFLLSGLFSWLASTQVGLKRILERKKLSRKTRIIEHLKILVITPIAAPIETSGALYVTLKWFLGYRKAKWIPTEK